jgi:hypothetical protein
LTAARKRPQPFSVEAIISEGATFSGVTFALTAEDQPSGQLPAGIVVDFGASAPALNSGASGELKALFRADDGAPEQGQLVLRVVSNEQSPLAFLRLNYRLVDATPKLVVLPNPVETGVTRGRSIGETVMLENRGLLPLKDVRVEILDAGGTRPAWAQLTSTALLGDIDVGEQRSVTLSLSPEENVSEGVYPLLMQIDSANAEPKTVTFGVTVTPSGEGQMLFKIEDIYTGTHDGDGNPIEGLEGASIRLQHEQIATITAGYTSGPGGEVLTDPLPTGTYRFRVTAPNRQEATGRIKVKAGVVTPERIFLDFEVVTVEWSVTDTTVEDRYDIVLTATYAVDVPTAVVIMEPASVSLPKMRAGDVFHGEITVTNYGLTRAESIELTLPENDEFLRYEVLSDSAPDTLEPKQRVTLPYRITALRTFGNEDDGNASGGGCFAYIGHIRLDAISVCANGDVTDRTTRTAFTYQAGNSCSGSSPVLVGGQCLGETNNPYACPDPGGNGGPSGGYTADFDFSGFPACRYIQDYICGGLGNGPGDE